MFKKSHKKKSHKKLMHRLAFASEETIFFGSGVDKPFSATAQDRESMSFLRLREGSSNNSNRKNSACCD